MVKTTIISRNCRFKIPRNFFFISLPSPFPAYAIRIVSALGNAASLGNNYISSQQVTKYQGLGENPPPPGISPALLVFFNFNGPRELCMSVFFVYVCLSVCLGSNELALVLPSVSDIRHSVSFSFRILSVHLALLQFFLVNYCTFLETLFIFKTYCCICLSP